MEDKINKLSIRSGGIQFIIMLLVNVVYYPIITYYISAKTKDATPAQIITNNNMEQFNNFYYLYYIQIFLFGLLTFFFCKYWVEKKLKSVNSNIEINKNEVNKNINDNKEELIKTISTNKEEFQGFRTNVYNYNHNNYDSITTRLFRDSLLWYVVNKDKDFLNNFADFIYRSHITVPQLEQYGMGKDFIDAYKLHVHNMDYNQVANSNPIVADIYEGKHNENKEPDINSENKTE